MTTQFHFHTGKEGEKIFEKGKRKEDGGFHSNSYLDFEKNLRQGVRESAPPLAQTIEAERENKQKESGGEIVIRREGR